MHIWKGGRALHLTEPKKIKKIPKIKQKTSQKTSNQTRRVSLPLFGELNLLTAAGTCKFDALHFTWCEGIVQQNSKSGKDVFLGRCLCNFMFVCMNEAILYSYMFSWDFRFISAIVCPILHNMHTNRLNGDGILRLEFLWPSDTNTIG